MWMYNRCIDRVKSSQHQCVEWTPQRESIRKAQVDTYVVSETVSAFQSKFSKAGMQ